MEDIRSKLFELQDLKYKELILWALRYINSNTNKIVKCAKTIYNQKIKNRVIRLQKKS